MTHVPGEAGERGARQNGIDGLYRARARRLNQFGSRSKQTNTFEKASQFVKPAGSQDGYVHLYYFIVVALNFIH